MTLRQRGESIVAFAPLWKAIEAPWPFTKPEKVVSNQKTTAERNRINVLGLIARRLCLSQRQLTVATGLQASTIYNIVRGLKEAGIVREGAPIQAERAGPKETELEIVPGCLWCAGVNLDISGHRIVIFDACGQTLAEETLPTSVPAPQLHARACERILACGAALGLERQRLGGVCVSVPGIVDPSSGVVVFSFSLKLESFALKAPMQALLNCPVWVERNVSCGAYAEHTRGSATETDSFIYFWLRALPERRPHLGLSLVIGEKVFAGCNYAAGEVDNSRTFGHNAGELAGMVLCAQTADVFYQALSNALANIVNLLDMRRIVLACNDENLTAERFARLQAQVAAQLVPIPSRRFEMVRSQLGMEALATGSALLALHRALAACLTNANA